MIGLPHKQGSMEWVDNNNDSRTRLDTSEARCSLSPSQVAGQSSSDGGRQGRSGNLGYQYVMRHCIKGSCQVYGYTRCTGCGGFRWLKPVSMSVVSWRKADVVECLKLC